MLELTEITFQIYDSFFVNGVFYQLLQDENKTECIVRSQDGNMYPLTTNMFVEISENCKIKLNHPVKYTVKYTDNIRIAFDAPRNVEIVKSVILSDDDFQDNIVTPNITETTIDQLLEEEFLINHDFTNMFIAKCFLGFLSKTDTIRGVYRSACQVCSGGDESDLIILAEHKNRTYALMIENKINASKQERQPQRYIERGIKGIHGNLWDVFETCLIAPESYLVTKRKIDYYHNYISYEEIISFLEKTIHDKRRLEFRKGQFEIAINKKEKFIRAPDIPEAVQFVKDIRHFAYKRVPEFLFDPEGTYANKKCLWFYFSKDDYPDGIKIILQQKAVVTQFKLPKYNYIKDKELLFKEHGFDFLMAKSGKSCTIRKTVEPINCLLTLESQKDNLNKSMDYICEMDVFLKENIF